MLRWLIKNTDKDLGRQSNKARQAFIAAITAHNQAQDACMVTHTSTRTIDRNTSPVAAALFAEIDENSARRDFIRARKVELEHSGLSTRKAKGIAKQEGQDLLNAYKKNTFVGRTI